MTPPALDTPAFAVWLPSARTVARGAVTYALEVAVLPSLLFYAAFATWGLRPALLVALGWTSVAIGRRAVRGRRIPATLVLSMALLLARTLVSWLSGSVFLYFLQPTLTTFLTAGVLLGSVVLGRPFVQKALQDYVPSLPADWSAHPGAHSFFRRCSLLWGAMSLFNATVTTWALLSTSLGPFLLISKAGGTALTGLTVAVSIVWFRRVLRADGVTVRFAPHRHAVPAPGTELLPV